MQLAPFTCRFERESLLISVYAWRNGSIAVFFSGLSKTRPNKNLIALIDLFRIILFDNNLSVLNPIQPR